MKKYQNELRIKGAFTINTAELQGTKKLLIIQKFELCQFEIIKFHCTWNLKTSPESRFGFANTQLWIKHSYLYRIRAAITSELNWYKPTFRKW